MPKIEIRITEVLNKKLRNARIALNAAENVKDLLRQVSRYRSSDPKLDQFQTDYEFPPVKWSGEMSGWNTDLMLKDSYFRLYS